MEVFFEVFLFRGGECVIICSIVSRLTDIMAKSIQVRTFFHQSYGKCSLYRHVST